MPYSIVKDHKDCPDSKPWAVVKKSDGSKVGCHESKDSAQKQIAAIESNESKADHAAFRTGFWPDE